MRTGSLEKVKGRTKGTNKEGEQLKKKIATKKHSRKKSFLLSLNKRICVQRLKHLPAMWETWVRSLGQEDPLEKEMATHSCILAWGIPWTEEPGGLRSMNSQRVGCDLVTKQQQNNNVIQLHEPSSPGVKGSPPIPSSPHYTGELQVE